MKKALITGISGQDGYYLAKLLIDKNYQVYGLDLNDHNLDKTLKNNLQNFYSVDLNYSEALYKIISEILPDEIYHLAAYHFSSQHSGNLKHDFNTFYKINVESTLNILNAIKDNSNKSKLFYSSSCQVFGNTKEYPQNEDTSFNPMCNYSISKVMSTYLCNFYSEEYNIRTNVGILYNHESPKRSNTFITTQIVNAAIEAKKGKNIKLEVNNINAHIDWGSAIDYVRAMWLILQNNENGNFIISSGKTHTIKEFSEITFSYFNLDYKNYIFQKKGITNKVNKKYYGINSKLKKLTGWKSEMSFENLIHSMITEKI